MPSNHQRQRQPKPKSTRQTTKPDPEALENGGSSLGSGLDNVGFVVDLFLDQSGRVRLTQALHVKSNEGEAWESWDERRLIDFFVQRAGLSLPKVQAKEFISRGVGIVPAHTQTQSRQLRRGESFDVQLFFGHGNLFRAGNNELNYYTSISAHTWGGLSTYFLAIGQGVIKSTDSAITVSIPKQNLEPGVYCVQADLTVTSHEENELLGPVASLTLKSSMVQVF